MPKNLYTRNGQFWGRIWHNGREHRRCLHTASEKAALKRLDAFKVEVATRPEPAAQALRVGFMVAVVEWEASFVKGLKPKTARRYLTSLQHLDAAFRDTTLDQITTARIGAFVATRRAADVAPSTIKNDLSALSGIIRVAIANGWADTNPAATWDRGVLKRAPKPQKPPSDDLVTRVLVYPRREGKDRLRDLVAFLRASGCRLDEAVGLEWGDVDLAAGTITLIRTKSGIPRVIRMVTAGGDAKAVLARLDRHPETDLVFWHDAGEHFRQASARLADLYKRVAAFEAAEGRRFTRFRTHDLRHAFAIAWLNAGGDIYELSRHLGHASVKTTEQNYLRWMDPAAKDRYEARARGWAQVEAEAPDRHRTGTAEAVQVPAIPSDEGQAYDW